MLPKTSATEVLQTRTTPNVMRKRRENKKLGHLLLIHLLNEV